VDDPGRVGGVEPTAGLDDDVHRARHRQRTVAPKQAGQVLARQVVHHQVGHPVGGGAEVDHPDDVLVLHDPGRPRLAAKALQGLGLAGQFGVQELDGEAAPDQRVLGLVHRAHPALAERARDAVLVGEELAHSRPVFLGLPQPSSRPGSRISSRSTSCLAWIKR